MGSTLVCDASCAQACSSRVACFAQFLPPRVRLQQLQSPAQSGREPQRPLVIEPAVIQVARRHPRRDALQALGLFGRSQELSHPLIREPVHSDAAVGFGPRAQPCDGIGAVGAFIAKRIKIAFGIAAAANILNHDVVSVARKPNWMGVHDGGGNVASVGLAHQERRLRAGVGRIVVVRNQFHAVAHAGAHATFEADAFAAIDQLGLAHGVRGSGKRAISSSAAASRVAACSSQRSPFSAEAGRGSPITPLGAMSRVSQANVAGAFSGSSIAGLEMSAM